MEQNNVKKIVYGAFMMALVTIGTMVIQIPTPATKGYINVGDSFIFLSSAGVYLIAYLCTDYGHACS